MSQPADTVFDNDDGAIHDEAEIERSQAHQICADMVGYHSAEGKQHGERDHKRSDDRRTQIAQKQE